MTRKQNGGRSVVILGAGLSGLSTAYHLGKSGADTSYAIYEKESTPGGLCRSVTTDGFTFDFAGHFLHLDDSYSRDLVTSLLASNLGKIVRDSWIYSKRTYTRYPFQGNLYGLPAEVVRECLVSFVEAYCERRGQAVATDGASFEAWTLKTFGAGIARHFMVPYNRKLWTVHPRYMTCNWMRGYVPSPGLGDVITGALMDSARVFGYNAHFVYPAHGGIQSLVDSLASRVGDIKLNKRAVKIAFDSREVKFSDGEKAGYDVLVSTMPLPELAAIVEGAPPEVRRAASLLRCNSVLNINLGVNRPRVSDRHWVYFPESKYVFYRVGFFSNFSPNMAPPGTSSLYVEIALQRGKAPANKEELVDRAVRDLIKAGILESPGEIVTKVVLDMDCAYVIHDRNHSKAVSIIQEFLRTNNIFSIGRYGAWEYSDMEDALLQGRDVATRILSAGGTFSKESVE